MVQKNSVTITDRINWVVNTLFHQAVAVVSAFIMWTLLNNFNLSRLYNWHVVLSVLAYMPLMIEAIILFAGENVWSQKLDRTKKYWIHGGMMFLSFALITVGIFIETYSSWSRKHFRTTHSLTGIISWVLFVLLLLPGVFAAKPISFNKKVRPVYFKFIHNILGMLCFLFGVVSLCYGLQKGSFKRFTSDEAVVSSICVISIATIWALIAPIISAYNQVKAIVSS